jgi:hypothetical protein
MKRIRQSIATVAASLVLAGGITTQTVAPATASDQPPIAAQNFAAGSQAPEGTITTGPQGIAAAPPTATTVASNVSIPGLLRTGASNDTAGAGTAYSKVTAVAARASWTQGPTTYTLSISASQVTSHCTDSPLAGTGTITGGVLIETARTGSSTTTQVLNLPQLATGQTYIYHRGEVYLGYNLDYQGFLLTEGILVVVPDQILVIAITGCSDSIHIVAGPS